MKYEEKTMLPVTNREKLRNMDDGELAAFLLDLMRNGDDCEICARRKFPCDGQCIAGLESWLQMKAIQGKEKSI